MGGADAPHGWNAVLGAWGAASSACTLGSDPAIRTRERAGNKRRGKHRHHWDHHHHRRRFTGDGGRLIGRYMYTTCLVSYTERGEIGEARRRCCSVVFLSDSTQRAERKRHRLTCLDATMRQVGSEPQSVYCCPSTNLPVYPIGTTTTTMRSSLRLPPVSSGIHTVCDTR